MASRDGFANDGSFLERFRKSQDDSEEKKKKLQELARKRQLDDLLKNRGKRTAEAGVTEAKRPRTEGKPNSYLDEVKKYENELSDKDRSARPLVK